MSLSPARSCERQGLVADQREERLVTRTPGGNKRAMQRIGAVVNEGLTRERGQCAAGLVQQKTGGGRVPVVTVVRREGDIERARRDARQPQCQRENLRFHAE